jgi:hypothetical protein
MTRISYVVALAMTAQALDACAALHIGSAQAAQAPAGSWRSTLTFAQQSASVGRYDEADSVLVAFARRYPASEDAIETTYWRAIFRMDPSNQHASLPTAMAALDGYLTDPRPRAHVSEATVIRRVAGQLDAMNHLAANAMTQAKDAQVTASNAKAQAADARADAAKAAEQPAVNSADEIKRLKDELAKANAELERIRKRLQPPPPRSGRN